MPGTSSAQIPKISKQLLFDSNKKILKKKEMQGGKLLLIYSIAKQVF